MLKLIIVSWRRAIIVFILGIFTIGILFKTGNTLRSEIAMNSPDESYKTYFEPGTPPMGSIEELYQDIFVTFLLPYIERAVDDYYGVPYTVAPYGVKILNVERLNGYRSFKFVVKLEIMPYIGPHNSVGIDHITIQVSAGPKVTIEKFEHIKSYVLPSRR